MGGFGAGEGEGEEKEGIAPERTGKAPAASLASSAARSASAISFAILAANSPSIWDIIDDRWACVHRGLEQDGQEYCGRLMEHSIKPQEKHMGVYVDTGCSLAKQKHPPFGSFSLPTEFCTLPSNDSSLRISLLLGGSRTGCFPLTLEDTCCDLEFVGLIRSEGKEDAFLAQDE